jgi:ubiquinone/menaquinone biosynthesis C-methylase UbiE
LNCITGPDSIHRYIADHVVRLVQSASHAQHPPSSYDPLSDIVEATRAIGDHLRAQILRALAAESYSVSELCHIFDIPQPALSHHLKVLHQAKLVAKRREGNSIYYRRNAEPNDQLRGGLFDAIDHTALPAAPGQRVTQVHADRHRKSVAFFAENAHRFADQQALISTADVYAQAIAEVMGHFAVYNGTLLEVGPGTGEVLEQLAGQFRSVIGVDNSRTMLQQASERVSMLPNVKLKQRDFFAMPAVRRYRAVVAAMVLHHMPSPQRFFHQARRVMKADGLLVVAELCRHDNDWVTAACGDTWLGFEANELQSWATKAGFTLAESQFLGQKNGFQIQIHGYQPTANFT